MSNVVTIEEIYLTGIKKIALSWNSWKSDMIVWPERRWIQTSVVVRVKNRAVFYIHDFALRSRYSIANRLQSVEAKRDSSYPFEIRVKIGTFRGTCVYCAIFIGILWCTLEPLRPMHTEMNTLWARTQSWTENCLIMIQWLCSGARPGLRKNKLIENVLF